MWMDGAVGVVEAFSRRGDCGYLTSRSNAQAVTACAVISAALGTVALPRGQLPAAVRCVHYDILGGLTVYRRNDAPADGQREALPTQAPPPPLTQISPPSQRQTSGAS